MSLPDTALYYKISLSMILLNKSTKIEQRYFSIDFMPPQFWSRKNKVFFCNTQNEKTTWQQQTPTDCSRMLLVVVWDIELGADTASTLGSVVCELRKRTCIHANHTTWFNNISRCYLFFFDFCCCPFTLFVESWFHHEKARTWPRIGELVRKECYDVEYRNALWLFHGVAC